MLDVVLDIVIIPLITTTTTTRTTTTTSITETLPTPTTSTTKTTTTTISTARIKTSTTATTAATTTTTKTTTSNTSGSIEHRNYINQENIIWNIEPTCSNVRIWSGFFQTEKNFDVVIVAGQPYSGSSDVNQMVSGPFEVRFTSDESHTAAGFTLLWKCTGEPRPL